MSARSVVQESVRRYVIDEAKSIEFGFTATPSTVTAADIYASRRTGVPASTLASQYAEGMDAGMVALMEQRWAAAENLCVVWGVTM